MLNFVCEKERSAEISKKFVEYIADAMKSNELTSLAGDHDDDDLLEKLTKLVTPTEIGFVFDEEDLIGEEPYGYVGPFFEEYLSSVEKIKSDYSNLGIEGYVSVKEYGVYDCISRQGVYTAADTNEVSFFDQVQCVVCHKWVNVDDAHTLLEDGEYEFDEDEEWLLPGGYGESGAAYCICSEECEEVAADKLDLVEDRPQYTPQDHFVYKFPRLYADVTTLEWMTENLEKEVMKDIESNAKLNAQLLVLELTNLGYTIVWTPATEEAVSEVVTTGYPEDFGANAFMVVYKRYNDGITTGDIRVIRAINRDREPGVADMCSDNSLRELVNAFYIVVNGLLKRMITEDVYDKYKSLDSQKEGVLLKTENDNLKFEILPKKKLPKLSGLDREMPEIKFF